MKALHHIGRKMTTLFTCLSTKAVVHVQRLLLGLEHVSAHLQLEVLGQKGLFGGQRHSDRSLLSGKLEPLISLAILFRKKISSISE